MKRTGYDAIIIEGKSAQPVYLWINDASVEFRDAGHLWGLEVAETERAIKKELVDDSVRVDVTGSNRISKLC